MKLNSVAREKCKIKVTISELTFLAFYGNYPLTKTILMSFTFQNYDFSSLSLRDLLHARNLYHLHLMNKKNVVATAVGFYRIRIEEPWPSKNKRQPDVKKFKSKIRTLENSEVRPYSWPAILVFVEKWEKEKELAHINPGDIVPKILFLPDGKAVPVCVIGALNVSPQSQTIDLGKLNFPRNTISGGFPLFTRVQQAQKIASFGCLVTDGHLYYALTNKHVAGEHGSKIYTLLDGRETEIGVAAEKQIDRKLFKEVYPQLSSDDVYLNMDIGLIEINDLTVWKTEIFNIGIMDELADLHGNNFSLQLIGKRVVGYGATSGNITGEIQALFYRYKSVGGFEYVSDFLIGSSKDQGAFQKSDKKIKPFSIAYGDSGTLLMIEQVEKNEQGRDQLKHYPVALLWGRQDLGTDNKIHPYGLATCLSTTCNILGIDLVRGWNIDMPNTWGKTGHFKIAAKACELVSNSNLKKLLMANQKNIGYTDDDLEGGNVVSGNTTTSFVPLGDVADIIWRRKRGMDDTNHFADMDESHPQVFGGKSLLQLCNKPENVDVDVWNKFYSDFEVVDSTKKPSGRGALPFRVWQMYNLMVDYISKGKVAEFVCVGGLLSHYVGDASQSLHVSHLHHGNDKSEKNVHSDYETNLLDRKMIELFAGVNKKAKKVRSSDILSGDGKEAAIRVIKLMKKTIKTLPPEEVIASWKSSAGHGKYDKMWNDLGDRTIRNIAEGAKVMAIIWQSAWLAGNGNQIPANALKEITRQKLMGLYNKKTFAESFRLHDPKLKTQLT